MARPDPLDQEDGLKPGRFGHAPALWLALPLLAGCALDAACDLPAGPPLLLAAVATALLWRWHGHAVAVPLLIAAAGVGAGCAWHQLKKAPRSPASVTRAFDELSVRVERASPGAGEEPGWTGMGVITDRDGPYHRRRVTISARGPCPAVGTELKIAGRLTALSGEGGGYAAWARSQGATLGLRGARTLGVLEPPSAFAEWCRGRRERLDRWLRTTPWPDETGGALLAATLLGRTSLIPAEEREAFQRTGTLHLFAISGLHIAGMAAAMAWTAKRLRLPSLAAGLTGLAGLWLYVQVTGAAPSATRAWIMAACLWAGRAFDRGSSPVQSLAVACSVTLVLHPEACTDTGFQLSYLAVAALLMAGGPAAERLGGPSAAELASPRSARGLPARMLSAARRTLAGGLCVSYAASVAGAPLTLSAFGTASWGGVFANLLLVPMSAPPLLLGMASACLLAWEPLLAVAAWLNGFAAAWLRLMSGLAEILSHAPGLTATATDVPAWAGPAWCATLLAILLAQSESRDPWRLLAGPTVALLAWLALFG
ncbi:MAG: ComEC/Rec2 family competence protein [Opitutia bacterium]